MRVSEQTLNSYSANERFNRVPRVCPYLRSQCAREACQPKSKKLQETHVRTGQGRQRAAKGGKGRQRAANRVPLLLQEAEVSELQRLLDSLSGMRVMPFAWRWLSPNHDMRKLDAFWRPYLGSDRALHLSSARVAAFLVALFSDIAEAAQLELCGLHLSLWCLEAVSMHGCRAHERFMFQHRMGPLPR